MTRQAPVTAAPPAEVPSCPDVLTGEARTEWDRMTDLLGAQGLITKFDRAALAMFCQAWARWLDAERQITATGGPVVRSPAGYPIQNPFISIGRAAAKEMRSLLGEFGLSPAARSRLLKGKQAPPRSAGLDALAGKPQGGNHHV